MDVRGEGRPPLAGLAGISLSVWAKARIPLVSVFALAILGPGAPRSSAADGLTLDAPTRASVGGPIQLVLKLPGSAAGYQARLSYDTAAVHLSQVQDRATAAAAARGWQVRDLGPVELDDGAVFGAYSCLRADCAGGGSSAAAEPLVGSGVAAAVELIADEPGLLRLRLSDAEAVDATGALLASVADEVVTIDVSGARSSPHAAPPARAERLVQPQALGHVRDATGDGRIDEADVTEAALSWAVAHRAGATCATGTTPAADANADGCMDVRDVQTFAGAAGPLPVLARGMFIRSEATGTYVVDSTGDEDDAVPGDGVCATSASTCTLRAAIEEANATTGPNTIEFDIPGDGVQTIQLTSSLPTISDTTGGTTIDGYTQPGASVNTDPLADNAQLMIQIRGNGPKSFDGPAITSADNTLRGLSFFDLGRSIFMYGSASTDNKVVGCFVGTDATGTFVNTKSILWASGIAIEERANHNEIGTTALVDRNVISGNSRHGIVTYNEESNYNVVYNNIIGLSPDGTRRLQNLKHGIDINAGSSYNQIGGTDAGERNVISGNGIPGVGGPSGIEVSHAATTTGNRIVGNYFGTDVSGTTAESWTYNLVYGVHLQDEVNHTVVSDNVIVNSRGGGIKIEGIGATANQIKDNRIGVTASGQPGPNRLYGVLVTEDGNTVGPGNEIANNPIGVWIRDPSTSNTITRNSIYSNDGLGIDLDPNGEVNPNDPGDIDAGANDKQNFPVLDVATPSLASGTACPGCTVEIFRSDSQGPGSQSGPGAGAYGEGETFLRSTTADSTGHFSVNMAAAAGDWITATATTPTGSTSEFSENVSVATSASAPPAPKLARTLVGPRSVTLRWKTSPSIGSAVTSYEIFRGTSSGGETLFATVGAVNSNLDLEVTPGTTYWYKVAAVNAAGVGTPSKEGAATPTGSGIIVSDRFDRTVANGFGTADFGGPWNVNSTSQTKVEKSEGVVYGWTQGGQDVRAWLPASVADQDIVAQLRLSATEPVGAAYQARVVARSQVDARDGYAARIVHNPNGSVTWFLASVQNEGGPGTVILGEGDLASPGTGAGSVWWVHLQTIGNTIRVKFWEDGVSEPKAWTLVTSDPVWPSGGAALGVFTGANMTVPFPDTGFMSFEADDIG